MSSVVFLVGIGYGAFVRATRPKDTSWRSQVPFYVVFLGALGISRQFEPYESVAIGVGFIVGMGTSAALGWLFIKLRGPSAPPLDVPKDDPLDS